MSSVTAHQTKELVLGKGINSWDWVLGASRTFNPKYLPFQIFNLNNGINFLYNYSTDEKYHQQTIFSHLFVFFNSHKTKRTKANTVKWVSRVNWKEISDNLCKISFRSLQERHCSFTKNTGFNTKWTRNESKDWQQNQFNGQSKHSFITNDLKGLKMILWQKFLLKYKQETICKKRENDEQVSYNLKSLKIKIKVTALAPSLDWSLKTILDKPTTMTPISARPAPASWFFMTLDLRKMTEKMRVVTMEPPLIIW